MSLTDYGTPCLVSMQSKKQEKSKRASSCILFLTTCRISESICDVIKTIVEQIGTWSFITVEPYMVYRTLTLSEWYYILWFIFHYLLDLKQYLGITMSKHKDMQHIQTEILLENIKQWLSGKKVSLKNSIQVFRNVKAHYLALRSKGT